MSTENTTTPSRRRFVNAPTSQNTRVALRAAKARNNSPNTSTENARLRASDRSRAFSAPTTTPTVAPPPGGPAWREGPRRNEEAPLRPSQHRLAGMAGGSLEDIVFRWIDDERERRQ